MFVEEARRMGAVPYLNRCNDYMSRLDASYTSDRLLLMQGEGISGDLQLEWRRTQREHEVYFTSDKIDDMEVERQELLGGILLFSQTFFVPTTKTTIIQRLKTKGVNPPNGEGLQLLFNYLLEEGADIEGSEIEQHHTAACAFMEYVKNNHSSLYTALSFHYSQAVARIYRERPKEFQRWADRGIFQLDALADAIAMSRLTTVTANVAPTRPPTSRSETPVFKPISSFSAITVNPQKHWQPPVGLKIKVFTDPPLGGQRPTRSDHRQVTRADATGPEYSHNPEKKLSQKPPWPKWGEVKAAPQGSDRCDSCHIKGHSRGNCRIFDLELLLRYGKLDLKPFDFAKQNQSYAARVIAHLKVHGALASVWTPGDWEHFEAVLDEKRKIVASQRNGGR